MTYISFSSRVDSPLRCYYLVGAPVWYGGGPEFKERTHWWMFFKSSTRSSTPAGAQIGSSILKLVFQSCEERRREGICIEKLIYIYIYYKESEWREELSKWKNGLPLSSKDLEYTYKAFPVLGLTQCDNSILDNLFVYH